MVRRFLSAISLCVVLLLVSTGSVAYAQATPRPTAAGMPAGYEGYKVYQDEVDAYHQSVADCSAPSLECLVRNTTRFVAIEWIMDIAGPNNSLATASLDSTTPVAIQGGGAIGGLYTMMSGMYAYPPANTSRYVADVMDNAGLVPPAYAQGLGFASLDPILSLWKSFRNVAYFFFIIILIVIGIMIMLRQKVSAQASVSAQQALPGIIISLILVTFSYAIAGLLIDAMYLSMFMIAGLFNFITKNTANVNLGNEMINMNIFQLGGLMFKGAALDTFNNNANVITSVISGLATSSGDSNPVTGFLGFLGGLTVSIVIAVAVLIGTVKLFFELLKSYASVIMGVVFAPLYLMMGALPGQNAFGPWIKNLVGNLAAFPTVLLFIIIFKVFTESLVENDSAGGFMPPFLIGNGQSGIAGYIIGLAILLALPEIVKKVKESMGAKDGGLGWMVAGAATARLKQGLPLGGRTAAIAGGSLASAPAYALELARGGGWKQAHARGTAVRKAVIGRGVGLTDNISRQIGANQPDYLNTVTNRIDKRWSPEVAERSRAFQTWEQMNRYMASGGMAPVGALPPAGTTTPSSSGTGSKP